MYGEWRSCTFVYGDPCIGESPPTPSLDLLFNNHFYTVTFCEMIIAEYVYVI